MKAGHNIVIPASLTGGAAILSVLTGLISGVSAGVVLVRALVSAVIAFLFIMTSSWVIRKFLPELLSDQAGQSSEASRNSRDTSPSGQAGSRVNIVMDEHSDAAGNGFSRDSEMAGQMDRLDNNDNQIAESDVKVHNSKPEESDMESISIQGGAESVDVLPSLDNLDLGVGNSRSDREDSQVDDVSPEPEVSLNSSGASAMDGVNDPAEIAKAVKTVLSRDQQK